ncbi:hypothetical protein NKR23_g10447 [Pleurostoma richardsiae]|uniref:Mid2 domain-containing protein n=1 Tax=Pleurostoma richardsiae TaxID=41990 RepID=A0AA38VBW9_9PEZI|nr:hypothetical protein NKR23_g10447 [Pleurostoma richardsiae]
MRLTLSRAGSLTAVAFYAVAISVDATAQNSVITFSDTDFFDNSTGASVFLVGDSSASRQFGWTTSDTVSVNAINLCDAQSDNVIATWSTGGANTGPQSKAAAPLSGPTSTQEASMASSTAASLQATASSTGGLVVVNSFQSLAVYAASGLYLQVNWSKPTGPMSDRVNTGQSYSAKFTVTDDATQRAQLDGQYMSHDPFKQEANPDSGPTAVATTSSAVDVASTSTASMATTSSSPTEGSSSPDSSSSHSSHKGLSTGAIIGIAVACGIVGLAVLGLLIWFFLFRNRGDGVTNMPYGSDRHPRTQDLIVEKEANAGVTESPHSPYSDDGHGIAAVPGGQESALMAAAGTSGAIPVPLEQVYAPYSDHPNSPLPGAVPVPDRRASQHRGDDVRQAAEPQDGMPDMTRSSVSRNITSSYAHLVEEGMTQDEIRRLEEEERQLDAAIEQAGRR